MASPPQSWRVERERRAQALDLLLRAERGRLMRQARFHSRRDEDAEDALSDACVQFLRYYNGPAGVDALRWMMLVTKRCAWAIRRKARARESRYKMTARGREREVLEAIVSDERVGPSELTVRGEETARVIALIEQLKPDERTALILLGLGCTYAEIREMRGWSVAKLHRCLVEGRARVRKLLERGDG